MRVCGARKEKRVALAWFPDLPRPHLSHLPAGHTLQVQSLHGPRFWLAYFGDYSNWILVFNRHSYCCAILCSPSDVLGTTCSSFIAQRRLARLQLGGRHYLFILNTSATTLHLHSLLYRLQATVVYNWKEEAVMSTRADADRTCTHTGIPYMLHTRTGNGRTAARYKDACGGVVVPCVGGSNVLPCATPAVCFLQVSSRPSSWALDTDAVASCSGLSFGMPQPSTDGDGANGSL